MYQQRHRLSFNFNKNETFSYNNNNNNRNVAPLSSFVFATFITLDVYRLLQRVHNINQLLDIGNVWVFFSTSSVLYALILPWLFIYEVVILPWGPGCPAGRLSYCVYHDGRDAWFLCTDSTANCGFPQSKAKIQCKSLNAKLQREQGHSRWKLRLR